MCCEKCKSKYRVLTDAFYRGSWMLDEYFIMDERRSEIVDSWGGGDIEEDFENWIKARCKCDTDE